jgi:Gpi18-like mannosyltransferase
MYVISLTTLLPLPELYSIKLPSVLCDYLAAWYIWRLAKRLLGNRLRTQVAVLVFLFLPTVVLNGAMWGQCDIMYTTGFLASLFYLLEGRPLMSLVAFGISCSLKPQAIFWCPLLAGLFIGGRLPWKLLWVPGAVYLASCLPAIAAGRPALEVLLHYSRVHDEPGLVHGATPNWYQFASERSPTLLWWTGVLLTLFCSSVLVLRMRKDLANCDCQGNWLVSFALLSVLFPPFFLPGMHQRYFFAADVISLVYAFCFPYGWYPALLIQLASLLAYCPFLFHTEPPCLRWMPLVVATAGGWIVKDLFVRVDPNAKSKVGR